MAALTFSDQAQEWFEQGLRGPRYDMTVEDIEAHLRRCHEVGQRYGVNLDASRIAPTAEAVEAEGRRKAALHKRRAGVIALKRKYGHEAAAAIVLKHSGRTIY